MKIPYAEFYAGEGTSEVDAVTSATDAKWKKEALVGGTYNNGDHQILGVIYNVDISSSDLAALGENNYGFVESDSVPAAYKEVSVKDGKVSFSAVLLKRSRALLFRLRRPANTAIIRLPSRIFLRLARSMAS